MRVDSTTTAVDAKAFKLSLDEYKRYRAEDAKQIEKLGVKALHQTISSDNPYVEIKYSEMIEIQK